MKKELRFYDTIKGLTDYDEWSYCEENKMWYEDLKEQLPLPTKQTEIVSDFICETKVNHDGFLCDNWDDVEEDKGDLEKFAQYVIGENNGFDCTYSAVLFKTATQSTILSFNDFGFLDLENFINKLKTEAFATEYIEYAFARKFIAWTDKNNQTRLVIHSYRPDDKYLKTLIDITVDRDILIGKLESIINIWKEVAYNAIKEQERILNKKAENPHFEVTINHFFPEFSTPVRKHIENELKFLERKHNIKILFAIENGSRAWNMASKNSDYDVRFVFKRNIKNYISLNLAKDVFEVYLDDEYNPCKPEDALVDMVGFDLMKYMGLLSKSNPTAIEWLMSDIVYLGSNDLPIRQYIQENFNPQTLIHHYVSLCKKHYNRYVSENKKVTHKMYLYMMRGLLNALYVYEKNSIPPLDFSQTLEAIKNHIPTEIYNTVKEIIEIKSSGLEKDAIARIPILDEFIQEFLNNPKPEIAKRNLDKELLNKFIQEELQKDDIPPQKQKTAQKNDSNNTEIPFIVKVIYFLLALFFLILMRG